MRISISVYHDCRSRTINPESDPCPVKLRIYFNRTTKHLPLILPDGSQIKLTKKDWSATQIQRPRGNAKELKAFFEREVSRARKIIKEMQQFDYNQFKRHFTGNLAGLSLTADMKAHAETLKPGTRHVHNYALLSLSSFLRKDDISYDDLTPRIIAEYVRHLEDSEKSADTIKTYLAIIQGRVNKIKKLGELPENYNPFRAYEAPKSVKRQKALTANQFQAILNYKSEKRAVQLARDIFVFCVLCNGQYTATVLRLKKSQIKGNWLHFVREKTKDSSGENLPAYITLPMREIIGRYPHGEYIFPTLNGLKEPEHYKAVFSERDKVNKRLKGTILPEINKTGLLKIKHCTVKYCRGTWFVIAQEIGGLSFEQASLAAGHSDIKMSKHYHTGRNLQAIEEAARKIG